MDATNLAELYDLPTMDWAAVVARLEGDLTQAPGTGGPDRHTWWLATIDADGSPHVNGIGAEWHDGTLWFETGLSSRKARNLLRDPRCTLSLATKEFDLVVRGTASVVEDPAVVAELAGVWAAGGWPCEVDASGTALTAPFSAPSAGPPPWHVFRVDMTSATALGTVEPGGCYDLAVVTTFTGWPVEAVELYEGLAAENTRAWWLAHKPIYDRCVRAPMDALVAQLGGGRVFRPNRDVRFSKDKSPYKLSCDAQLEGGGYVSFSADGLFVGCGLYMPSAPQLARFRAAVADDRSGPALEQVVSDLRAGGYEVGAHEVLKTTPRGYPADHPRIELLRHKGLVMSRSWPVGAWLGTAEAGTRVVAALADGRPLQDWLREHVGP